MNQSPCEQQIRRFLKSNNPEVIAIKGAWGVGKTYAWKAILKSARDDNAIHLKKYAYVSLFSITSLEELRRAIFESVIDTELIGDLLH